MSFAETLRKELAAVPVKRPCCRRAMIAGFFPALTETERKPVWKLRSATAADTLAELIRLQYGIEAERTREGKCGRYYEIVSANSPALRKLLGKIREEKNPAESVGFSCDACPSAFLRGMFLSAGTVNDPHSAAHLEFLCPDEQSATVAVEFLSGVGYEPHRVQRQFGIGLYYKSRGAVEELIALMGSNHGFFEMMNGRIERDIRNNENRATNCDTRNIGRIVAATGKQTAAIEKLTACGRLDSLPPELQVTAKLRMEHPEASLETLAKLHNPPVTKSGLNHRLRKLLEEADSVSGS